MNDVTLSLAIEELMVARNLRNMQVARAALQPDYYLRAAQLLRDIRGTVVIGTGFPVNFTQDVYFRQNTGFATVQYVGNCTHQATVDGAHGAGDQP